MKLENNRRLHTLDVARGLAVLLMVLDHIWLARAFPCAWLIRKVITRAALPIFMMVSGYLWAVRGWSWRRGTLLVLAAMLSVRLAAGAGLPMPDILTIFAVVQAMAALAVRWPIPLAAAGLLQSSEWRIGWPNYEPGVVLCFCCLGVLLAKMGELPTLRCRWLEWIGRHPLTWYLGHLAALALWRAAYAI